MSLVAWYPLNGDTLDYSGNNNVATNSGATLNTNGKIGSCYSFNGSSNYMTIPNNIQNTSVYSITFWMKPNSPSAWTDVLSFNTGETTNAFRIEYDGSGYYRSYGIGPIANTATLFAYSGTAWVHVAIVCDGITAKCYFNGVQSYSGALISSKTPTTSTILLGARTTGACWWNGYLNDVRIYNTALSSKEVYEISKAKILHYKFDDFQETTTNLMRTDLSPVAVNDTGSNLAVVPYTYQGMSGYRVTKTATAGWGSYLCWDMLNNKITDTTRKYSFSIYGATLNGINQQFPLQFMNGGSQNIAISFDTLSFTSNLQLLSSVNKSVEGTYVPTQLDTQMHSNLAATNLDIFIAFPQLEMKDHCTPYVSNSRPATIRDCSGYGVDAPLSNDAPRWISTSKIGYGAYGFNSAFSQYICIPNSQCKVTDQITVSVWAYRTNWNEATSERIISCTEGGGWSLGFNDVVNNLSSVLYCNGAYTNVPVLLSTISAGWHHIAFTFDGRYQKLYLDGVLKGTVDKGATYPVGYNSTNSIFIGAEAGSNVAVPAGQYWNGNVDDVRIYATALSASDIQSLYDTRASLDNYGNMYVNQLKYQFPKSAYDIKLKYPNAPSGIYTIQPDPNTDPFEAYCDMTTDGGGWTLLVCSTTSTGWTTTNVLSRNSTTPSITSDYSILNKADVIKSNIGGNLQYRFDATAFGRYGGSFSAPYSYTFTKTDNSQTSVSLITQYDSWTYKDDGIEQRMPWLGSASGLLTTSTLNSGNWWGTIVSNASFNPAPWISGANGGPTDPGKIWYWVR